MVAFNDFSILSHITMAIPTKYYCFPEVFSQTICKCHFLPYQVSVTDTTCTSLYRALYAFISYKYFMLLTILLQDPLIDKWTVLNRINKVTKVADCIMHMLMDKILV